MSTRRRALFAFVLALGLALFGLLARERDVLGLALPLALFAAVLVTSDALYRPSTLRVARELSASQVYEDEHVDVTLSATNEGEHDVWVSLCDTVPHGITVVLGDPALAGRLREGETVTRTYRVNASRGGHDQRQLLGTTWAPWGLAARDVTFSLQSTLTALPVFESLRGIEIRPRHVHAYAGSIRTGRAGSGLATLGCREYTPGDDIRRINWRASARRDDLIVNLYEQERMTDVNIIVDARAHMHLQIGEVKTFDLVVRGAAAIASHFLRQSNRVGLLVYGDTINWTFPGSGRLQMERLLHALALARPSNRLAFGKLRQIPTRLFAAGSQLVIFSTLGSSEDEDVPVQMAARGYSVLLVYPNTLALERSAISPGASLDLAGRLVRLGQHASLSRLARAGVHVVDWDLTEPLAVAFHHAGQFERGVHR